jgi:class 3 adenylate cyclase/CHASE2 domain-containing sensor protein
MAVKLQLLKFVPIFIIGCVITLVCVVSALRLDFFERLERMTYDLRARAALKFPQPAATNLGFVFINESSLTAVHNGSLGYHYGLYWPRQVYGRLVQELVAQGAKAVAFDVIFAGLRPDHPPVQMADRRLIESDDFFALQVRHASNVIIAVTTEVQPPALFANNARALGDISTDKDSDGILRHVKAFRSYRRWHPAFEQAAHDYNLDLSQARIETNRIVLFQADGGEIPVPLDEKGNFSMADFGGDKLPPGVPPKARPFTHKRVWHMGIVLAAQELNLDLAKAEVDLEHGRIVLRGSGGVERIIPVDDKGFFYVDWCLPPDNPRLTQEPIENLLLQNKMRLGGELDGLTNRWRGKLVVVGSAVQGNELTDRGATPLEKDTLLVSKHWNVANSVITGRFIRRSSVPTEIWLIVVMGILSALVTWNLRPVLASSVVVLSIVIYVAWGFVVYVQSRYWLPLVFPVVGAWLLTYVTLMTWRAVFEHAARRHVKNVFSRIVSPNIVNELLKTEKFALGGARREITVYFADIRGFTSLTDDNQEMAAEYVRANKLSEAEAESYFDEQARETLHTVNSYLALIADMVKNHAGTLDKYIGDCVMAFWGAPTANSKHALVCVHAAIEAQRVMRELNLQRKAENKKLELENQARAAAGLPPRPLLPLLMLGSGINTGLATVGLMGSEAHISNYTVFGREVNLASRLEGLSGRGRILIGETTYAHLLRDDPALAATCVELPPVTVKGIRTAVKVYEVPWRPPGAPPLEEEFPTANAGAANSH